MDEYNISIIIPIYNVEKYLAKCIDSVINQDYEKVQIVLVNDGTTDNSVAIAQKYVDENDNVILISQKNQGLGGARNTGMKAASGKYILFVDSDDYIEQGCISRLVTEAEEKQLDILQAGFNKVDDSGAVLMTETCECVDVVMEGSRFLQENNAIYGACFCLYRREFLEENRLVFMPGVYHEDMDFTLHAAFRAERIESIDYPFYNYLLRESSITSEKSERRILDYFKVSEFVSNWISKESDEKTYELFFREYLAFLFSHVVNMCVITGIPMKLILGDNHRRDVILKYLKESKRKVYHIEYMLLKAKLYGVYKLMYKVTKK